MIIRPPAHPPTAKKGWQSHAIVTCAAAPLVEPPVGRHGNIPAVEPTIGRLLTAPANQGRERRRGLDRVWHRLGPDSKGWTLTLGRVVDL